MSPSLHRSLYGMMVIVWKSSTFWCLIQHSMRQIFLNAYLMYIASRKSGFFPSIFAISWVLPSIAHILVIYLEQNNVGPTSLIILEVGKSVVRDFFIFLNARLLYHCGLNLCKCSHARFIEYYKNIQPWLRETEDYFISCGNIHKNVFDFNPETLVRTGRSRLLMVYM